MKYVKLFIAVTLAFAVCSCGANKSSASDSANVEEQVEEQVEAQAVNGDSTVNTQDYSDMIKTVYEKAVFSNDENSEVYTHPEQYFTAKALKKLKDSYEYGCEDDNCYAFYELRTMAQDSKPGTNEESSVINIESLGDDWYLVKYLDMGWTGTTRIKIVDGKIDEFNRESEE